MPAALRAVRVSLCASHLGYPVERTPLGGGAVVAGELARHWAAGGRLELSLIGSGPVAPGELRYTRAGAPPAGRQGAEDLTSLGEFAYARFCRRFEADATRLLLDDRPAAAVINDVSESPDLARLKQSGMKVVSIWHVDVADFFSRMYLGLPTRAAVSVYERLRVLRGAFPDVLRLVFEKQRESARLSDQVVVPSAGVAETLLRCYGRIAPGLEGRLLVLPWGAVDSPEGAPEAGAKLRREYGISSQTPVLMTLSRISPEKGLTRLLQALRLLERRGGREAVLFVCGAPAFMQGRREERRLKTLASKLERTRVVFPGYVAGEAKQAYFRAADVFVAPSVHESYGLAAAEALRAGLPVVAAANNGMNELLGKGGGMLVAEGPGFVEGLADALALLEDEPRRRRLSLAAAGSVAPFGAAARRLAAELERLAEAA